VLAASGQLTPCEGAVGIAAGVTLRPTPGHTPGHQVVLVESAGRTVAVTGDAAPLRLHVQHPDWELPGDHRPVVAMATRRQLIDWATARRAVVVPYHEPADCWVQLGEDT
jgi:glyoxylase-like metal-dependent hydrolase (beta-lactamase superfamily II)